MKTLFLPRKHNWGGLGPKTLMLISKCANTYKKFQCLAVSVSVSWDVETKNHIWVKSIVGKGITQNNPEIDLIFVFYFLKLEAKELAFPS